MGDEFEEPTPGIKQVCSQCGKEVPKDCSGNCKTGVR